VISAGHPHPGDVDHGVLLTVAYDGRGLAGFAKQRDTRTIAGELEGALREIDPRVSDVRGASRTDSGVHARGQRVAFDPSAERPLAAWVLGTARYLPDTIVVRRASRVARGFVPRFASRSKHYRYLLLADGVRDPFWEGRAWRIPELRGDDVLACAHDEARLAIGTHDFAAFKTAADPRTMTERTLTELAVTRDPSEPRVVRVDVRGNAFMHNMVRILVGTIVDVARGRLEPGAIGRALASRDRSDGGITAPPDGLYLESMELEVEELEVFEP
jgi:tRNA pseudouridine38-40 synthase